MFEQISSTGILLCERLHAGEAMLSVRMSERKYLNMQV